MNLLPSCGVASDFNFIANIGYSGEVWCRFFSECQSKIIHQHNGVDHSVKIMGRQESKLLPEITMKKQNVSLLTAAGMTENMKETEKNTISVSEIFLS